jgi:LysR family glycine cleavage system transcriptional activator
MSKRLPSLNALCAFVAVARHGGVSRAAEALNLTHSAVSHQIRALQEELGITLFEKVGRGLALTAEGSRFATRVEAAFGEIEDAAHEIGANTHKRLRINTISSFAACWLLPRLGDFISSCPEIDVDVQSTNKPTDLKSGEADVWIAFGTGPYPGLFCELLLRDWLFPVCSPEFARRYKLHDHAWIDGVPLMHSDYEPWSLWFPAAGITAREPERGIMFDNSALILQAASKGQGLGLVRHSLAYDDLAAGRLVRPFSAYVDSPMSYFFLCRMDKLETRPVARFRQWIKHQIADFPTRIDSPPEEASAPRR